ncbi:hypothetical protein ILUMI_11326 [Ignelater luminosus]|uniref:Thioredoxin domain-containing protein n=1 Tax=Ignelater luminosus TaxID=2038154 RepID=A0A8K0GDC6_IGNLU|nr:hypothetical protein ILUMI_11326 [Ignelater luminosus]
MDGEDEFFDSISYSHQKLTQYIRKKGVIQQDLAVKEYLADIKYPPVGDFQKGLEWFNVSEPLSFTKHLKGKVVLLDFFTYCCINCMHILPDLKDIENEFSVEDGLVVIGVHSAKFENEKVSKYILAAVQRYNIAHPVVNDNESFMWRNCDVHCWPTLVLLGPNANPIVMLMGEGHKEDLLLYIKNAIEYYKSRNEISSHKIPFKSAYHLLPDLKGPLLFPGKIASYIDEQNNSEILAISDTGSNRILVVQHDGTLIQEVGGSRMGFKDGNLEEAQFNAPQGLTFLDNYTLFVADTENHAIRKIDLKNNHVSTVAGIGEQGRDHKGGRSGTCQEISSPWDVCIFKTPDLGSSTDNNLKNVLIIAMAGTHQIWALFLADTIWWKNQRFTAGTCVCIAGSGREENKNNQYPHASAFAQPSGLALCNKNKEVYIADSESSSIRRLSLVDGKVSAVVGGDRNPNNLFAFGDKDGKQYESKLQHVLGLAMAKAEDVLFVADTYNHKIKKVDISTNTISTINTSGTNLNEPAGLCISADGKKLYIADTNNHDIRIIEFDSNYSIVKINKLELKLNIKKRISKIDKSKLHLVLGKPVFVNSKGGKLIITTNLDFRDGLALASDAPQNWNVHLPSASWSCVPNSDSNVLNFDVVISVPPMDVENAVVDFVYNLVTCSSDSCFPRSFIIQQPVNFSTNAPFSQNVSLKLSLDRSKVALELLNKY